MKIKKRVVKIVAAGLIAVGAGLGLAGCYSDADQVSENLSTEAEQFRIYRDIVFVNGITDKYLAEIKGYCSVDAQAGLPGRALAVTCRIGPNQYTKDYLGVSDNVTWYMLQVDAADVSRYHKEIILKPESVIPDIRIEAGQQ